MDANSERYEVLRAALLESAKSLDNDSLRKLIAAVRTLKKRQGESAACSESLIANVKQGGSG